MRDAIIEAVRAQDGVGGIKAFAAYDDFLHAEVQAGPAAVRPATEDRWFRDNEDDPERHCYRTEDGDEVVVYASREQAERMIAALSGAAVRPVEREGVNATTFPGTVPGTCLSHRVYDCPQCHPRTLPR